eukprot:jgi/Mesvir1/16895/Mv15771-RA.8
MDPPAHFLCPISYDLMRDPVILVETGQTYERDAIEQWFARGNNTDPLTNARVIDTKLVPVFALRCAVAQWVEQEQERQRLGISGSDVLVPQIAQDRLVLGSTLHDGAMATVSAAVLRPGGQQVVVKMFRARGLTEDDSARFRREVRILHQASVFCHNVCRLIGVATINGQLCMVMPRYTASLEDLLRQHQRSLEGSNTGPASKGLPLDRTLGISLDIALAIADLHERGIMVLDLKPANILLDNYGRAVVADFGISALRNSTLSLYMPTSVQGTPNYMAPEQWVPDEFGGLTTSADAWGFGCILVEMASGSAPWAGLSMFQMMANVSKFQRLSPAIPEGLPSALADLLRRCFSYQPADRPTFAEIIAVLRHVTVAGAATMRPAPPQPQATETSLKDRLHTSPKTATGVLDIPLMVQQAAKEGRVDAICQLVLQGADLSAMDKDGKNALLWAAEEGQLALVEYLVERQGMSLSAVDQHGTNALHLAAEGGQLALVKYLVERQGMSLSAVDKRWNHDVLDCAAIKGHLGVVKYLVEDKGMNLDKKGHCNQTILHNAARGGHLELVKYLVEDKRMDVNAMDGWQYSALHYAAKGGRLEVVQYLVEDKRMCLFPEELGVDNVLHCAAEGGNLELVKYLVEDKRMDVGCYGRGWTSVLHCAATGGNLEVVKYLVEDKRMNVHDDYGCRTVLENAVRAGKLEVVKYLVENKGVDVNAKDCFGMEGQWFRAAAEQGHLEVVKYLAEDKGSDVNTKDCFEDNALHLAAYFGHLEVVKYLVEGKGMNVNAKNKSGETPLHGAAWGMSPELVKYLVEDKGMDVNARDNNGRNALLHAAKGIQRGVIKYLVEDRGMDISAKDNSGRNALHCAAAGSYALDIIQYLVEDRGMDVHAKDNEGHDALFIAVETKRPAYMVEYLKSVQNAPARAHQPATARSTNIAPRTTQNRTQGPAQSSPTPQGAEQTLRDGRTGGPAASLPQGSAVRPQNSAFRPQDGALMPTAPPASAFNVTNPSNAQSSERERPQPFAASALVTTRPAGNQQALLACANAASGNQQAHVANATASNQQAHLASAAASNRQAHLASPAASNQQAHLSSAAVSNQQLHLASVTASNPSVPSLLWATLVLAFGIALGVMTTWAYKS